MDCVVPFHAKDISLPYSIASLKQQPEIDRIVVVTAKANEAFVRGLGVDYLDEEAAVEGLHRKEIATRLWFRMVTLAARARRRLTGRGRIPPDGWLFQQFLKLALAYSPHVRSSQYLVVDSDTVFLRPIPLRDGARALLFRGPLHDRAPAVYYRTFDTMAEQVFGVFNHTGHQFICHNMVFDKTRVRELLSRPAEGRSFRRRRMRRRNRRHGVEHGFVWRELTMRQMRYFSEYQLYAQFMLSHHPSEVRVRPDLWCDYPWPMAWFLRDPERTRRMLEAVKNLSPALAYASFHDHLPEKLGVDQLDAEEVTRIYESATHPLDVHRRLLPLLHPPREEARAQFARNLAKLESAYFV